MVFWNSCFFYDLTNVGDLISGSFAFSKSNLTISEFLVHVLLRHGLENFERYFASMWNECTCVIVWTFFGIALLWDWSENWSFPVLWQWHLTPVLLPGKSHGWRSLRSMGSRRVRHNRATLLSLFTFMHWRRKWQPTPVFLPGESQGQQSLVGCHLWGRRESDTTEVTQQQQQASAEFSTRDWNVKVEVKRYGKYQAHLALEWKMKQNL